MCAIYVPVPEAYLSIPMHSFCLVLNGSNAMIVTSRNVVLSLSQVLGLAEQRESFLQEISTVWEAGCITQHECRGSKPVQVCVGQNKRKHKNCPSAFLKVGVIPAVTA